jgi:hypothetical protein
MNLVKRIENLEARPLMRIAPAEVVSLDGPEDVLALLAEQVNEVRANVRADPTERARTLGFLSSLALRAIDSRDITARLEAVERVLKLREKKQEESAKWWKKKG